MSRLHQRINRVNQEFGADGYNDGDDDENESGRPWTHLWLLGILIILVSLLSVEKIGVSAELEDQVQDVQDQEDDGSAVGQDENVLIGVLLSRLGESGVKLYMSDINQRRYPGPLTVAGIIRLAVATTINELMVEATVELKFC